MPDAGPTWMTAGEVLAEFGLAPGTEHGDPRSPVALQNKLDGQLRRLWLRDDVEQLAARLTVAAETDQERLTREIVARLDASAQARATERSAHR